jgi:pheromone shutdown protein TraB
MVARMQKNLREFSEHVRKALVDERSERIVRVMLEKTAQSGPLHVVAQLGQCLVDCRKSELRSEAEQN